jgi:exopolyphosphatase/guanosine-5'-triphosphate,3'-diphosphate pyrophosphatase
MRAAVLDLGSNSFRLLVAEVSADGALSTVVRDREELGLGAVVARHGAIPDGVLEVARTTVERFTATSLRVGADFVLPIATSAVRDADNRSAVLEALSESIGSPVRLLSGHEEARLSFIGMRAGAGLEAGSSLTLDLGGGSLDCAAGDDHHVAWTESLPLGGARLTAAHLQRDPPTRAELDRLHRHIAAALGGVEQRVRRAPPEQIVAAGGSVRALARLVGARRWEHPPMTVHLMSVGRRELLGLHRELAGMNQAERLRLAPLKARKQDVLPAASAVLAIATEQLDLRELLVSTWGLREGVIIEACHLASEASTQTRDLRRAAVRRLALNWARDPGHGDHVAHLAGQVFDATAEALDLTGDDRELLDHAAHLHDIGESIAFGGHHKHGAYLIEHAELHGFASWELATLATIVRFHKGSGPKPSYPPFDGLGRERQRRAAVLTAVLRLADGLDHDHDQRVDTVTLDIRPRRLVVRVAGVGDLNGALDGAAAKGDLLAKALGRELSVEAVERLAVSFGSLAGPVAERLPPGSGDRDGEAEGGAHALFAVDPHPAAVGLGDVADEGQAQAGPAGLA